MFSSIDPGIAVAVIALVQSVAIAIIGGLFQRETKRRKKHDDERRTHDRKVEERAKIRAEESRLSMKLMSANTSLTIATALAVQEGKTNGKMANALALAEQAQRDYYDFINRVASTQMTAD